MAPPKKEQEESKDNLNQDKLRQFLELLNLQAQQQQPPQPTEHKFWKTQPVPQQELTKDVTPGSIEGDKPQEALRKEPLPLPKEFEWCLVNIEDDAELKDLYELLNLNYGEDQHEMFRFDYSPEFLRWALNPPGWKAHWHIGIRVAANKKLVAFISAIPMRVSVVGDTKEMVEINFLCVHKKLRNKRFSPVMIKEITRRVNLEGIFQAVYTAGITIPTPIATCPYYHRSINFPKLVDVKFSYVPRDSTMELELEKYKLPDTLSLALRPMEEKDVGRVQTLINDFGTQFKLAPVFHTKESISHWHLPIDKVNYSYVLEDEKGEIQDFVSFYQLNSSILFHEEHKTLNIAYLNYYASSRYNALKGQANQTEEEKEQYQSHITELINNVLILAKQKNFDVFNCVENLHSSLFLEDLNFHKGDGNLNYYLFNYKTPCMSPDEIGLIML